MNASKRAIVSVATDSWTVGQERLVREFRAFGEANVITWTNRLPMGCPPHRDRGLLAAHRSLCTPYAFKAYAMHIAAETGNRMLLWADACIRPLRPLDEIWARVERDGVWICRNGWRNSDWTADSAYADLFTTADLTGCDDDIRPPLQAYRELNQTIPHVVATTFALDTEHPKGRAFLDEYFRLASKTQAFRGPWRNTNCPSQMTGVATDHAAGHCGPATTLGHRHDQTAAAVIAWRLGIPLCDPPDGFAYAKSETDKTVLIADGVY